MFKNKRKRIGLVSCPMGKANIQPFVSLINILSNINSDNAVIAILDKNVSINNILNNDNEIFSIIIHESGVNNFSRIKNYIKTQIIVSSKIVRNNDVTIWFFYIDNGLILPIIISKVLHKKTIILLGGSLEREVLLKKKYIEKLSLILAKINRFFCNSIILYSPLLISDWKLEPYRHKIIIAGEHFIDFTTFTVTTPYIGRPPLIGYIGRLSLEKGVQQFVKALPSILSERENLKALIGGDGQLKDTIEASLQKAGITDRIDFTGWISHEELPHYLNQLRLLILPSYTEGLPNIMLEAMACGTPVLATPVGAIPDVIRDGETGFIMEDNKPETIARHVQRALNSPDLEAIAERGRKYMEQDFTFEKAVERWGEIFKENQ